MRNYKQGIFRPQNPDKYKGDTNNIVYRSSWELVVMKKLDLNKDVIEWSSEETVIPYYSEVDKKYRRYFVDFTVKVKQKDNSIKKFLIEVKPFKQTVPPKPRKRKTRQLINEEIEYIRNQNKWQAAKAWAKHNGYEFMILTENTKAKNDNQKFN